MFCHILKTTVFYFIAVTLAAGNAAGRFISFTNASDIHISEVPYIVRLKSKADLSPQLCGGTLIGPQHVVTAAHCFDDEYKEDVVVIGGVTTLHEQGVRRRISQLYIHPQYREDHPRMDIAVIKLNESMPIGNNIQTIKLCDKSKTLNDSDVIQLSGWGATINSSVVPSENLRTTLTPVMSNNECFKQYNELSSTLFTADIFAAVVCGKPGYFNCCRGDSGGPAIHERELCGVASFGASCGGGEFPGVYTNINVVRDFIEEKIKL